MAHLNHRGPEENGPKTGRKLGLCRKTEEEKKSTGEMGIGMGNHYHHPDATGNGKRINYFKTK